MRSSTFHLCMGMSLPAHAPPGLGSRMNQLQPSASVDWARAMLPGTPESAGIVPLAAEAQPQQAPASQEAGHEPAGGVITAAGPQPEQPDEADAKLKAQGGSTPMASPAPSSSTMGAAGAPDEGAAAEPSAAAGGARAEQPPGKASPAGSSKQGKKKVVRTKDEFTKVRCRSWVGEGRPQAGFVVVRHRSSAGLGQAVHGSPGCTLRRDLVLA